jgi:hypothetical protein
MSNHWTVTPETKRIENLEFRGRSFWIEVKQQLTKGEKDHVRTSGFRAVTGFGGSDRPGRVGDAKEPQIVVDWAAQSMAQTLEYLVDWSLADDKGNKLPLRPPSAKLDTVNALHEGLYEVIEAAIAAHVEAQDREKKVTAGEPAPSAISA